VRKPLVLAVLQSNLPEFLRRGLAGRLAALADERGHFKPWLTVNWLVKHPPPGYRHLKRRTIQYHLHALERCGFLRIVGVGGGRGHGRQYSIHVDALATVQAADPILRPAHRRDGVMCRAFTKGCNSVETAAQTPEIAALTRDVPTSPHVAPSAPHAPPAAASTPPSHTHKRRWDAPLAPDQYFKVATKIAHVLFDELIAAGTLDVTESEVIEMLKTRLSNEIGSTYNTGVVLTALDNAAYRRRMLGMTVPVHAGSKGQAAFMVDRRQHAEHARMDARRA
jgi:hypothetical protein